MKISLLTNGIYPFAMGGMQKHSYYLARYLAKRKIDVNIYHYKSKNIQDRTLKDYFEPEELGYMNFYEFDFPASIYFPGHYIYNSYRYSCKIYEHLKKNMGDVDFIYAQGFTGWKTLVEKKSNKKIPPVGVNFHGLEMFQRAADTYSKIEQYLFRSPAKYCLRQADAAFSLGGKLTGILEQQTDKSTCIWETPIGIEDKWLAKDASSANENKKFVFIGRYERRKGIQELNKAITEISKEYTFDFEFIGPIPEAHQLNLSECKYHGAIYEEQKIMNILSGCDVLVCPSYSEGMPTVILEAMSRGLAVIATDVGAVSELVSAQTGWLIQPANISTLKTALRDAMKLPDAELKEKKEAALKLIADKFTWNKVINMTLEKIDEIF